MKRCECGCMEFGKNAKAEEGREIQKPRDTQKTKDQDQEERSTKTVER